MMVYISHSAEETFALGKELSQQVEPNRVLCFYGDLGAGKTTLIKGFVAGFLGSSGEEVNSPTFTYLNIYPGSRPVYHFDLYRLKDGDEFLSMGFDEMFEAGGVCCIEWAEKLSGLELPNKIEITLSYLGEGTRSIEVVRHG